MQCLVADIYELSDCGNGTLLNFSCCLDDLLYSGQAYCRYLSYYSSII